MPLSNLEVREALAAFIRALQDLSPLASQANVNPRSLQQQFLIAQQLYQQALAPTLATSAAAAVFTPYQTEINRALRLLAMDVTFLQTAKNTITVQKRQAQIQQRLQTLLGFSCQLQTQLAENFSGLEDAGE